MIDKKFYQALPSLFLCALSVVICACALISRVRSAPIDATGAHPQNPENSGRRAPVEEDRSSPSTAPTATTPTPPEVTVPANPSPGDVVKGGDAPLNLNRYGWVEIQHPVYGLRFAAPCFWYVDFPEEVGIGQAYSLRNYSYEYASSFQPDGGEMWARGGIKIDIVFPKRVHPSVTMQEYLANSHSEDPDSEIVSIEELQINHQEALHVTNQSSVFGVSHFYMMAPSDEAFVVFSPSPGAFQNPDVQAILNSITFDPEAELVLPEFYPGLPIEGVIADCKGASSLEALMTGPKSIAWASGKAVKINFALVNRTDQRLYLLQWQTPFEGIAGNIFHVMRDGQEVPYQGFSVSRGAPTADAYLAIDPKGTITIEVVLSSAYDFSQPGRYTISYTSPTSSSLVFSEADFASTFEALGPVSIPTNELTLEITGDD